MIVIHNFAMSLYHNGVPPTIDVVQFDSMTRKISVSLFGNGGETWVVPGSVTAAVAFNKPDGHKGLYDKLPDGTDATEISSNTVTAVLAPQVLTCAGDVMAAIVLNDENLEQLATFPIRIRVSANPAAGETKSNDYYNYSTMAEVNAAIDEAFSAIREAEENCAPAIVCEESGSNITLNDASNRLLKGLNLCGKTTRNGTPTADTEAILTTAGTGGSIGVAVTGKNLFGGDALADALVAKAGATKNETAGTVQYSASSVTGKRIFKAPDRNKQYTVILYGKNTTATTTRVNLSWYYLDGTSDVFNFETAGELSYCVATSTAGKQVVALYGYNSSSSTILYYDQCGIFEGVLTETDFESYIGSSLTVSTPNGLAGIPVSSGGNYTDENGQQWICDEIDFARGVRITRLAELVFDGVSNGKRIYGTDSSQLEASKTTIYAYMNYGFINPPALSSTTVYANYSGVSLSTAISITRSKAWLGLPQGEALTTTQVVTAYNTKLKELYDAGKPVRVLYQRKTPVETPLSAEELAAYAAMHTNKPNTTVYNDAGAGMKLQYVADTKIYIDNKFTELQNAILSSGANV